MNSEQIENILRHPPVIKIPADLFEKLVADIQLPRTQSERIVWTAQPLWLRRWMPALSFITVFLVCLVAIAVQTNILSALRYENDKLRGEQGNLDALRAANAEYQRLFNENQQLDRLRRDNAEMKGLRDEVAQLTAQSKDEASVRAANAKLHAATPDTSAAAPDFFDEAKARAERIKCVNNLKQIGLAARIWSGDNNDVYPTNFISMTNELATWVILQCPSDKSRDVGSWADVESGNISYIMDAPGVTLTNPQVIFAECPIHHNVCLVDGSVQQLSPQVYKERIKVVDGLKVLQMGPQ